MKVLCFDIGGTNIKYGIIEDGVILEKSMFATHYKRGHKDVTDRLIATAKKVQKNHVFSNPSKFRIYRKKLPPH